MTIDEKARELRNAYQREYRRKHPEIRKKQLEYTRKWKQAHPEKQKEYRRRYWEKKAAQALQNEEKTRAQSAVLAKDGHSEERT